jgi:protein-S-isoprenylcysteine O-methyltransferase Ste14
MLHWHAGVPFARMVEAGHIHHGAAWRYVMQRLFLVCLFAAVLFGTAGTLAWDRAWLFLASSVGLEIITLFALALAAPEMLAHRGAGHEGVKFFDRIFVVAWFLILLATPAAAGIDFRLGLTAHYAQSTGLAAYSGIACGVGIVLLILGYLLGLWAMLVNRHFEQFVRIQRDRAHGVITKGPYRIVRHPGYAATMIGAVATPLILGSWTAAGGAAACVALFCLRTALEDRTLRCELNGYEDYACRTRYRLVPGLW